MSAGSKPSAAERQRAYYEANRDKVAERQRAYQRAYYEANRDKVAASSAPAFTYYASCPCGSVMQIMGELDGEDYVAIEDWNSEHEHCQEDM